MSMIGKRAEIADALSTATGVRGYQVRPNASTTGDAWPQWRGTVQRDENTGQFVHAWAALVQLPADYQAADAWVDAHLADLWAALESVGWITGFQPVDLAGGEGRNLGLMITMESE